MKIRIKKQDELVKVLKNCKKEYMYVQFKPSFVWKLFIWSMQLSGGLVVIYNLIKIF